MISIADLGSFIMVVFGLFLIPGPAVLLIITQSTHRGTKTGIMTGLGIATGDFIHVLLATAGFSAILMTSTVAFTIVKIAGAAYLFYMGIRTLTAKVSSIDLPVAAQETASKVYRQGIMVETLNPKTALFFLALFPQFVNEESGTIVTQFLILGIIFVVLTLIYATILAVFTGTIRQLFKHENRINRWGNIVLGLIYIGLGLQVILLGP